jgi:hypothetical protein
MGERSIHVPCQLTKWLVKMASDVQAVWIEALRLVELAESSVDTSIPELSQDLCGEGY